MAIVAAQGTKVELAEDPATPTWVQIKCPKTINDIDSGEPEEIDTTNLCSTAKEFRLGIADNGSMNLEMDWDPADPGQIIIQNAVDAVETPALGCRITFVSGAVFTYTVLPKSFKKTVGVNQMVSGMANLRVTGPVARS